jgi:hypothetical protein
MVEFAILAGNGKLEFIPWPSLSIDCLWRTIRHGYRRGCGCSTPRARTRRHGVLLIPGDGVRFAVGPVRISIVSAARVAMWAALVIAARHAFYRTPPLPARVIEWLQTGVAWVDVRFATLIVFATRVPPILIGLLAVATIGSAAPVGYQPYENPLLNLPARWDAIWYSQIAAFGYTFDGNPLRQQSIVFFPAFPLAIRLVNRFMGGHLFYAAWVVALAAFALAIPGSFAWRGTTWTSGQLPTVCGCSPAIRSPSTSALPTQRARSCSRRVPCFWPCTSGGSGPPRCGVWPQDSYDRTAGCWQSRSSCWRFTGRCGRRRCASGCAV